MGGSLAQGTAANALNLVSTSAGIGNQMAESQYQSQMNQYGAQQAANQGIVQGLQGLGSAGLGIANAGTMANYYNNLSQTGQGYQNTLGGLPSMNTATSYLNDLGYSNPGSGLTALPNTGAGTAYPFGQG